MADVLHLHAFAAAAKPYARLLDAACVKHGYSQLAAFVQIAAESAWNPAATSPVGAIGLCQIMPATAVDWGCDPREADQSIDALVAHMRDYVIEFKGNLGEALAAYNAGPGAVMEYGGVPPYPETQEYVAKIIATIDAARPYWPAFWAGLLESAA